jgi:hypothetical protein
VTLVAGGITTAVGMLNFKSQAVENGTTIDVDRKGSDFWNRN